MLGIARDEQRYPGRIPPVWSRSKLIVSADGYRPAVELMRFAAPFGVGFYSGGDDEKEHHCRRPVYIDGWAPKVEWTQDITDRYSCLEGDVYVGILIDTWTAEGIILASLTLEVKVGRSRDAFCSVHGCCRSSIPCHTWGSRCPTCLPVAAAVDAGACKGEEPNLQYITTGHGGHSGGDEFTNNSIS